MPKLKLLSSNGPYIHIKNGPTSVANTEAKINKFRLIYNLSCNVP